METNRNKKRITKNASPSNCSAVLCLAFKIKMILNLKGSNQPLKNAVIQNTQYFSAPPHPYKVGTQIDEYTSAVENT